MAAMLRAQSPYETRPAYPNPRDGKNSTVLTSRDLDNLTRTAFTQPSLADAERSKKATLRERSQSRYKNWGNTLEAQREKKIRARQKNLEDIEKAQLALDKEEATYEDTKRRQCIERANRMLFQQQDKTKEFQSSLLLSKTLQERQDQIHMHRQKIYHEEMMEQMWIAQRDEQIRKALQREQVEEITRKKKGQELAQMQIEQLATTQERMAVAKMREIEEGRVIKAIAKEALEEEHAMEEARKLKQKQNNAEYMRANQEQQKIKAQRARLEKAEDDKIIEYAREKQRLDEARRAHEAARFAAKQASYQKMLDKQAAYLVSLQTDEAKRLETQVREKEEKADKESAAEAARRAQQKENTRLSREQQILRKVQEKRRQDVEDTIRVQEWQRRSEQMNELNRMEVETTRRMNKKHEEFLINQANEVKARSRMEKLSDLERARIHQLKLAQDDKVYQDYAQECIDDFAARGRTVVPMKLVLNKQKKREVRLF